ncbi:MAG: hypothetical protein Fur0037_06990 [Planctomycetota bacterium]
MIFVTVGSQMPFDRLVRAVDDWAVARGRGDLFFQVGAGGTAARSGESAERLSPAEFRERLRGADLVVGHAGTGTILSALEFDRPLLMLPRRADLGETRTDHQMSTVRRLGQRPGIAAAATEEDLVRLLDGPWPARPGACPVPESRTRLIAAIRDFLAHLEDPGRA